MTSPNALLVVAKRPAAGHTKTRLCPPLSGDAAAALYECFLRDTLDIMRAVPLVQRTVVFLPEDADGYFKDLAPDMTLVLQQGDTLGERLDHLLAHVLGNGAERAVVMDSDSPTLPAAFIEDAFSRLHSADVVLGPCRDGGYYLIGMSRPHPRLLREVQMSTPHVLADTLALAQELGVTVSLLPEWYDVDTAAELDHLHAEIEALACSGNHAGLAVHTRRYLADLAW